MQHVPVEIPGVEVVKFVPNAIALPVDVLEHAQSAAAHHGISRVLNFQHIL